MWLALVRQRNSNSEFGGEFLFSKIKFDVLLFFIFGFRFLAPREGQSANQMVGMQGASNVYMRSISLWCDIQPSAIVDFACVF